MIKARIILLLSFTVLIGASHSTFAATQNEFRENHQKEIEELDKSIDMLKKWKSQYIHRQKSQEARRKRVLFRSQTTKDAQKAQKLADEAKENAHEIQGQIDVLVARKNSLLSMNN